MVQAIRLAEHLGAIHVVLEIDSHLLMLALNKREADASSMVPDEFKFEIRTNFSLYDVVACNMNWIAE